MEREYKILYMRKLRAALTFEETENWWEEEQAAYTKVYWNSNIANLSAGW
jgi:hypothetical protein